MHEAISMARPMESGDYPWYDSVWLSAFQRACAVVRAVSPGREREFVQAFDALRTAPDFEVKFFEHVFDEETLDEIRRLTASLAPAQLEMHEARIFKRFVVHNHPFFCELQKRVLALASQAAGEALEVSYNFLSLYGPQGVCPLHLDAPSAKWTLDLCIDQSDPWPIFFSPVCPWPEMGAYGQDWESQIRRDLAGSFSSRTLLPGQAVLFSGSSQWHYREVMPGTGGNRFCDLLFFHFIPKGTSELVNPEAWAQMFGIPELADNLVIGGAPGPTN